ncbi:NAD(P)/FAD-dependent oxidoreductase [Halioxenophilus sp. WMMB6]|uniref:NAD(P)/FAD-dependent oxidoreductase n=1 Tax=Halioxenophilus sp. WMMB6 TaxID=3073815 RepID=UPI00295EC02F|nr:NAD(P)/FAD-dependent oxidoreductase [Halioxenophilus sp. WMMB6]
MKIVIVGGGAGGLELATKLGQKLGKKGRAEVVLVDRSQTHIWKPLLHEVASGSLDADVEGVSYRAHGHINGYTFKLGELSGVNPETRTIQLRAMQNAQGEEFLPARIESYDLLVLAIGSVANDYGTAGVALHCIFLDSLKQAKRFHQRLLEKFIQLNKRLEEGDTQSVLRVAIIGGGATGVELAAELHRAREWFATYGLKNLTAEHLQLTLIEAGPRLLPQLNERISGGAAAELVNLGVDVRTNTAVTAATNEGFETGSGELIAADMMVWAAGVKAPEFLTQIPGLEFNRANQILVKSTLQSTRYDNLFALGDCAGFSLPTADGKPRWVPPRAQSAHQMADTVACNVVRLLQGKSLQEFRYQDFGSLVSLSDYSAFGRLMGGLARGGLSLEGTLARWAYLSLYRMHQLAIYGWFRTLLITISDRLNRFIRPKLKLH